MSVLDPLAGLEPIVLDIPSPVDIATAIVNLVLKTIAFALEDLMDNFFEVTLYDLVKLTNPLGIDAAIQAWGDVLSVALVLLPILVAFGVLSMPFETDKQVGLFDQAWRLTQVILFISISQGAIAFGVELHNAVVDELTPSSPGSSWFQPSGATNPADYASGQGQGSIGSYAAYIYLFPVYFGLMSLAILISYPLFVVRDLLVIVVFISSPLLGAMYYLNWGPAEAVAGYAATIGRSLLFNILAGPILILILRSFTVLHNSSYTPTEWFSSSVAASFFGDLIIIMLLPFVLVAFIWKTVNQVGEELGIGDAVDMAGTAVAGAVTAGVGAAAGGAAGGAAGSGSSGAAAGGSGGATGSTTAAASSSGGGSGGTSVDHIGLEEVSALGGCATTRSRQRNRGRAPA